LVSKPVEEKECHEAPETKKGKETGGHPGTTEMGPPRGPAPSNENDFTKGGEKKDVGLVVSGSQL